MTARRCRPAAAPLRGTVAVPGDKSISHRFALLAPLAAGESRARGWLRAADTEASLAAVRALGAAAAWDGEELRISPGRFPAAGAAPAGGPPVTIDCGNSGTTARLLLGLLAGRRVRAVLDGDASLRRRPMDRVVEPLRRMGAAVTWRGEPGRLPLQVEGRPLRGLAYRLPVPSAQVKSALLLAGLTAGGPVTLEGCRGSRDHTERLLSGMGAPVAGRGGADRVALRGPVAEPLRTLDLDVPGDPSSAAFLHAAALLVPGSRVTVAGMLLNPTRTGYLEVLRRMGAAPAIRRRAAAAEPWGDVTVTHAPLRPFTVAGEIVPTLVDELPVLAVLAATADGVSRLRGAAELRVKESDRIALTAAGLRALGVTVDEHPDGLDVHGRPDREWPAAPVPVATGGDHRIAMAFAVLALATRAGVVLDDAACVGVSFPDVFAVLDGLQRGE